MHPFREIFDNLRHHAPDELRHRAKHHFIREMARHGRGRGFGHFVSHFFEDAGFDRSALRTGRKLGSDDLQLLLLALIQDKPSHGYDLIKLLAERSGGYYAPSPGMVYPALTYLEEAGHATVEPDGTKKRYQITQQGRDHLAQNRAHVDALLAQLDRIGNRMDDMHHAFGEGRKDDDNNHELRELRHALGHALREHKHASAEERRRIADILRRAIQEINAKQ
jgi:DNA-binding PadR family transcriptional regulator